MLFLTSPDSYCGEWEQYARKASRSHLCIFMIVLELVINTILTFCMNLLAVFDL